jgi:peptidoglycan/LPS O-acetylase OafA/YrhL
MLTKTTFGSVLDANKGIGPGFDALRVILSISILCFHSASIAGERGDPAAGPAGYVAALLVPAFFAVSGFLVIASAIRVGSLATFLTFRGLRILPALFTEVVITAMIVGPLATKLNWFSYFTDPEFFAYFRNLIGNVHFNLPGVFSDNPMKAVNASLWTIRPEIVCYLALALILLAQLHKSTTFFAGLTCALFAAMVTLSMMQSSGPWGMTFAAQAKYFFYFIAGNLAYHLRYRIPFNLTLLAFAAVASIVLLQSPGWEILAAFPLVYCTVFAGLVPLPMFGIFSRGDYSYGIYLFAYPIQQLVASLPWTRGISTSSSRSRSRLAQRHCHGIGLRNHFCL